MANIAEQRLNIAVLDDYQRVAETLADWSRLEATIDFVHEHIPGPPVLAHRIRECEVIVAMRERTPFPREILEVLPNLKLLVTTAPYNSSIDLAAARELGITVCGTESLPYPTAELTVGLVLALARGIVSEANAVRSGKWQQGLGVDLNGSTLGIIGLGNLGSRVARVAKAFDMTLLAWSQNLTQERAREHDAERVELDQLLALSDFVSIHLKLGERTRQLIGAREIGLMRPTAFLVNTSRAAIVDQDALLSAVRNGAIAGAAVDVFTEEPLPKNHPLRQESRILATPHIGYVTRETYKVFYAGAVEAIAAWQAGAPIRVISG